jgi:hypothetical protein
MAWTVTATLHKEFEASDATKIGVFRLACLADANASGDFTLSTLLTTAYGATKAQMLMDMFVRGARPYQLVYLPTAGATEPTSNPTITLDDQDGVLIYTKQHTAATGLVEIIDNSHGGLVYVYDLIFASTTLANTKTCSVDIWMIK